jgi:hypothetical protein
MQQAQRLGQRMGGGIGVVQVDGKQDFLGHGASPQKAGLV